MFLHYAVILLLPVSQSSGKNLGVNIGFLWEMGGRGEGRGVC